MRSPCVPLHPHRDHPGCARRLHVDAAVANVETFTRRNIERRSRLERTRRIRLLGNSLALAEKQIETGKAKEAVTRLTQLLQTPNMRAHQAEIHSMRAKAYDKLGNTAAAAQDKAAAARLGKR